MDFSGELRSTWRHLWRRPGQSALIIGVLGLGIGWVAAVWGVAWGTLWRGLPFPGADRLHAVFVVDGDSPQGRTTASLETFRHLAEAREDGTGDGSGEGSVDGSVIRQVEGWLPLAFVLTGLDHHAVQMNGTYITPRLLDAVDVPPILGRKVLDSGGGPEAVIGERLWREHLGAAESVIGRVLTINDRPTRVVGVMPEGFRFPYNQELWVSFDTAIAERFGWVQTLVRLEADGAPGSGNGGQVDPRRARAELESRMTTTGTAGEVGDGAAQPGFEPPRLLLEPYGAAYHDPEMEKALHLALAAVGALLLVACANVTNLVLVRGLGRGQELAIRSALGASRARLISLLGLEAVLLSVVGAGVGLGVAALALRLHERVAPPGGPSWIDIRFDASVVGAVAAAAGLCCLVAGLLPAWRTSHGSTEQQLREGGGGLSAGGAAGRSGGRLRSSLVVVQVALCTGLLVAMGNITQTLEAMGAELEPLDRSDVVVLRLSVYGTSHAGERDALPDFWRRLRARLEARPEVRAAAFADDPTSARRSFAFELEDGAGTTHLAAVSPGFFDLLDQPLIAGRDFAPADGVAERPPVALVSRSFAERHWPEEAGSALGARLRYDSERNPEAPWRTIVGVVPDLALGGLDAVDRAGIYVPRAEWAAATSQQLVLRLEPGAASPGRPAGALAEAAIHDFDPEIAVYWAHPLGQRLREGLAGRERIRSLLAILAITALLLAGAGLYGVLALAISHRRRELAVRSALGARARDLARLVVNSSLRQTTLGLALGILVAERLARALEQLYGIDPWQPRVVAFVLATLASVAGLAAWLPGRRAAETDPADVLRES